MWAVGTDRRSSSISVSVLPIPPGREGSGSRSDSTQTLPILTAGWPLLRRVFESLLDQGFLLRVDLRDPPSSPWLWPTTCYSVVDLAAALDVIRGSESDSTFHLNFPVLVWSIPGARSSLAGHMPGEPLVDGLIDRFMSHGDDTSLWEKILALGVIRASISMTSCTFAFESSMIAEVDKLVRDAVQDSPVPVEWL